MGERDGEEVEGDISVDIDEEEDEDDEEGSRFKRSRNDSRPSKRSLDDVVDDDENIEPNRRKGTTTGIMPRSSLRLKRLQTSDEEEGHDGREENNDDHAIEVNNANEGEAQDAGNFSGEHQDEGNLKHNGPC